MATKKNRTKKAARPNTTAAMEAKVAALESIIKGLSARIEILEARQARPNPPAIPQIPRIPTIPWAPADEDGPWRRPRPITPRSFWENPIICMVREG